MKDYRNLNVWEKSHSLVLSIYKATAEFPKAELYGLTSQIRRAGYSIPANIAEGCGRRGNAELARFLDISMGSASELEYHLLLAKDLTYLTPKDYDILSANLLEVRRMLNGLLQKVKSET